MKKIILTSICIVCCFVACDSPNVVPDAPVRCVEPLARVELAADSSFVYDFPEVSFCVYMNIIQDSLLALYDKPISGQSDYFYKIYSLKDYSYLGECVRKGRGPDEFLEPMISESYIHDLAQNKLFYYNFSEQVKEPSHVSSILRLPDMTFYTAPYRDTLHFIMCLDQKRLLCKIIDEKEEILQTIDLYSDALDAETHISQLGNCVQVNDSEGVVALMMLSLPQVNYLSLETGQVHSSAVDVRYKKWRHIINHTRPDELMDSPQYYNDATSSDDYIMGIYLNRSINDMINGNEPDPHIHVFDWSGNFLCDLKVREHISNIEFDAARGDLYGLDISNGRIYRYNMYALLDNISFVIEN